MIYDLRLNIDKKLLDEQVKTLLDLRFSPSWNNSKGTEDIDGLIEMLEAIQDIIDKATMWKPIEDYKDDKSTEPVTIGRVVCQPSDTDENNKQ